MEVGTRINPVLYECHWGNCIMSRHKWLSMILEKAELRAASMHSIVPELDLGNGRTLELYWEAIDRLRAKQQQYNALLSTVDQLYNEMLLEERSLGEMSKHMLSVVKVKFSRGSDEYETAGRMRRSERKRPQRKAVAV